MYEYVRSGQLDARELQHIARYDELHRQRIVDATVQLQECMTRQSFACVSASLRQSIKREVLDRLRDKKAGADKAESSSRRSSAISTRLQRSARHGWERQHELRNRHGTHQRTSRHVSASARVPMTITPNSVSNEFNTAVRTAQNRFANAPASGDCNNELASDQQVPRTVPAALRFDIYNRSRNKHGVPVGLALGVLPGAELRISVPTQSQRLVHRASCSLCLGLPKGLGVTDPFNAEQSIEGGIKYLQERAQDFQWRCEAGACVLTTQAPAQCASTVAFLPYPETQNT